MTASPSALYPASYAPWLSRRLPGLLNERLATCGSCAMTSPTGLTRDPGPFAPDLKCCTYFPFVPNFTLGAMLRDPLSRTRVFSTGDRGLLLPLGLFASPEHEARVQEAGSEGFGRRRDLLCPFYDTAANGCSVWAYRPGVCASYFCKSERAAAGLELWADIETYLNQFEWALANEAVLQLGFTDDELRRCEAAMLADPGEEREAYVRAAWAEWHGREEELFALCTERALQTTPEALDELLGEDALALEASINART